MVFCRKELRDWLVFFFGIGAVYNAIYGDVKYGLKLLARTVFGGVCVAIACRVALQLLRNRTRWTTAAAAAAAADARPDENKEAEYRRQQGDLTARLQQRADREGKDYAERVLEPKRLRELEEAEKEYYRFTSGRPFAGVGHALGRFDDGDGVSGRDADSGRGIPQGDGGRGKATATVSSSSSEAAAAAASRDDRDAATERERSAIAGTYWSTARSAPTASLSGDGGAGAHLRRLPLGELAASPNASLVVSSSTPQSSTPTATASLRRRPAGKVTMPAAPLPAEPAADDPAAVTVGFRTPSGQTHRRRFYKSDLLAALYDYMLTLGYGDANYVLATSFPRRLIESHDGVQIAAAGLEKSVLLNVEAREV